MLSTVYSIYKGTRSCCSWRSTEKSRQFMLLIKGVQDGFSSFNMMFSNNERGMQKKPKTHNTSLYKERQIVRAFWLLFCEWANGHYSQVWSYKAFVCCFWVSRRHPIDLQKKLDVEWVGPAEPFSCLFIVFKLHFYYPRMDIFYYLCRTYRIFLQILQ